MTDWYTIESQVWKSLDCHPVATESLWRPTRADRVRQKKRQQASEGLRRFRDVMESDDPPKSRDEAIKAVIGAFGYLLAVIFPQYALLIRIITVSWDLLENSK